MLTPSDAAVLVVEDDPASVNLLTLHLKAAGFEVAVAPDGVTGLELARQLHPACIVLDIMLPGLDGLEVCRRLRQADESLPIIMLTARDTVQQRVDGLENGADDYLVKPFAFEELLARVEALGRRPKEIRDPVLLVGDLELDTATREVRRAGTPIELTPKEYTVLEYLMRHTGRVMSRTLITEYAWDYHFDPGTNIVDVVINRLRKKVDSGHAQKLVHTVRGVGYVVKA